MALSVIPVIITAWFFGLPFGILAVFLVILFEIQILSTYESNNLLVIMQKGGWAGIITTILLAFIVSYFRRLHKQLKVELAERIKVETALRQNEKMLSRTFDQLPIGAAIVSLDHRYVKVNQSFCNMLGYDEKYLTGRSFSEVTYPDDIAAEYGLSEKLRADEIDQYHIDKRYIHHSGKIIWVHLSMQIMKSHDGKALYFLPIMEDITERKLAEEALAKEAAINAALADLSHALISESSCQEMPGLVVEHATRLTDSAIGLVGYTDPQNGFLVTSHQVNEKWAGIEPTRNTFASNDVFHFWKSILENTKPIIANYPQSDEQLNVITGGRIPVHRFLSVPAMIDGQLVGQIAVADANRNYSEEDMAILERMADLYGAAVYRQQLKEQYYFLSIHDSLTGLYNRRYFEEEIKRIASIHQFPISVIIGDLDRLKIANDHNGHVFGDTLIQLAGNLLQSTFRSDDVIARIGGDEFAILLSQTSAAGAATAVQRIYKVVEHHNSQNPSLLISISLGSATAENFADLAGIVKKADAAMYQDKTSRRRTGIRPYP